MKCTLQASCFALILIVSSPDRIWSQMPLTAPQPSGTNPSPVHHAGLTLPFRLSWGYLVIVEGSIGNLHKLNFVVDTGACPTLVDRAIAKRLGLATQPARVSLSNRSIQTEIAVLPSLAVGPIQVTSLPVLTQDLTLLGKAMGQNVDGIVGLDVLRKSNFSINYETRKMEFGAIERLPWFAVFETEAPIVTVRMEFLGRRFRIAIDTGGPDLMLFQTRISSGTDFRAFGSEEVKDLGGTYRRRKVLIPDVQLGEIRIGSQIAFVVDDRKDDGDNFDGVLGVKGAHFRRIAFDFGDRRFYWD